MEDVLISALTLVLERQHAAAIVDMRSTLTAKVALQSTTVFRRMAGATRHALTLGLVHLSVAATPGTH